MSDAIDLDRTERAVVLVIGLILLVCGFFPSLILDTLAAAAHVRTESLTRPK